MVRSTSLFDSGFTESLQIFRRPYRRGLGCICSCKVLPAPEPYDHVEAIQNSGIAGFPRARGWSPRIAKLDCWDYQSHRRGMHRFYVSSWSYSRVGEVYVMANDGSAPDTKQMRYKSQVSSGDLGQRNGEKDSVVSILRPHASKYRRSKAAMGLTFRGFELHLVHEGIDSQAALGLGDHPRRENRGKQDVVDCLSRAVGYPRWYGVHSRVPCLGIRMDGRDRSRRSTSGRSAQRMHYRGGGISGLRARLWEQLGHARLLALGFDKPAERAIEIYSRRARHLVDPRINFSKIVAHG